MPWESGWETGDFPGGVTIGPNGDIAARSVTTSTSGPYSPTAVPGGADHNGAVRITGGDPWYDITHPKYGCKADNGVTDNTAGINAAIADAKLTGGTVFVPASANLYQCTGQIVATNLLNVRFLGDGAGPSNSVGSWVTTSVTGSGNAFDFTGGNGVTIQSIGLGYTSASFTGSLVKWPVTNGSIRDSSLRGVGGTTTATYLLNLDTANDCFFDRVFFSYAQYAVLGQALGGASSSNVQSFRNCDFDSNIVVCHVRNPGNGWAFFNCDFENLTGTTGAALIVDASTNPAGLSYTGCWFGDATSASAFTWLLWHGNGLSVHGCYISQGVNNAGTGIKVDQAANALDVAGNEFSHLSVGIALGAGLCVGVFIGPNDYGGSVPTTTQITGTANTAGPTLIMPQTGTTQLAAQGNLQLGSTNAILLQVNGNSTANVSAQRISLFAGLAHQKQSPAFNAGPNPDPTLGEIYEMAALTGAVNVGNPVNGSQGDRIRFYWKQDGTGGRAVAYTGSNFRSVGIAAQVTTLNTYTIDEAECLDGTIWRVVRLVTGQTV